MALKDTILATSGLVSLWEFDEAAGLGSPFTAVDSFGSDNATYAHSGSSLNGVTLGGAGVSGTCAQFDGTSGSAVSTSVVNLTTASVEVWFYLTANPASNRIVFDLRNGYGNGKANLQLYVTSSGVLHGYVNDGADHDITGAVVPLNKWVQAALTADGTTARLYLDGGQVASAACGNLSVGFTVPNAYVGGSFSGFMWPGKVDAVSLYNAALPASTVAAHYLAGVPWPAGTGGRTSGDGSPASLGFGTTNVLSGATSAFWSLWVNVAAWSQASQTLWGKDDSPTSAAGWGFGRNGTGDQAAFFMRGGGTTTQINDTSTAFSAIGGWVHLGVWSQPQATTGNGLTIFRAGSYSASLAYFATQSANPFANAASPMAVLLQSPGVVAAEPAVWKNVTEADAYTLAANLAAGRSPTAQAVAPAFYARFGSGATETDLAGGLTSTVPSNALAVAGPAVDPPTATGTGAPAPGKFAASGSGSAAWVGTGSAALGHFAASGSAAVTSSGSGSPALGRFAASGSSGGTAAGAGSPALKPFAASGSAASASSGSGAPALRPFAASASGGPVVSGSGAVALRGFAASGSAADRSTGTGSAGLGRFGVAAGAGAVTGNGVAPAGDYWAASYFPGAFFPPPYFDGTENNAGVVASPGAPPFLRRLAFVPPIMGLAVATGSGSVTLGKFAAHGLAGAGAGGLGAATLKKFAAAGTVTVTATGAGTVTLRKFAASGAGGAAATASGSVRLGAFAVAGSAAGVAAGSGAVVLWPFAAAGTASLSGTAAGAVALRPFAVDGSTSGAASGSGAVTLGAFAVASGSAQSLTGAAGTGSIALGAFAPDGTGSVTGNAGTGSVVLGRFTPDGSGVLSSTGTGAVVLGRFAAAGGSGLGTAGGTGAIVLYPFAAAGAGSAAYPPALASGSVALGRFFVVPGAAGTAAYAPALGTGSVTLGHFLVDPGSGTGALSSGGSGAIVLGPFAVDAASGGLAPGSGCPPFLLRKLAACVQPVAPDLLPDLVSASLAWLRADPALVKAFGETAVVKKFWTDAAVAPALPWLRLTEFDEPVGQETEEFDGSTHYYALNGELQLSVFAATKLQARTLRGLVVARLTDAPLVFADGVLMALRPKTLAAPFKDSAGPHAPVVYHAVTTFAYFVDRTY